jgi:mannose-6-phosphate isomerase-like protein (cupin superfamily)
MAVDYIVTEQHFTTGEEAVGEIIARGWEAVEYEVPAEETELHWHDYEAVAFVLEGTMQTVFEDGSVLRCGPGTRVEQPSRVLHRSDSVSYRAVFGFSVRREDMTRPISKPASELHRELSASPEWRGRSSEE